MENVPNNLVLIRLRLRIVQILQNVFCKTFLFFFSTAKITFFYWSGLGRTHIVNSWTNLRIKRSPIRCGSSVDVAYTVGVQHFVVVAVAYLMWASPRTLTFGPAVLQYVRVRQRKSKQSKIG